MMWFYCGDTASGKGNVFKTCTPICMRRIDLKKCKKSCKLFQKALFDEAMAEKRRKTICITMMTQK